MAHYEHGSDYSQIQIGDTITNAYGETSQVVRKVGNIGYSLYNPEYNTISYLFKYAPEKRIYAVTE